MLNREGMLAHVLAVSLVMIALVVAVRAELTPGHAVIYLTMVAILGSFSALDSFGPAVSATIVSIIGIGWHHFGHPTSGEAMLAYLLFTAVCVFLLAQQRLLYRARVRTARAKAQAAQFLADELNLLIDGADNLAIFMLDLQERVTIWNTGAERLLGWSEADVIGAGADIFHRPATVAEGGLAALFEQARQSGRVAAEQWLRRRDGSEFLAEVRITALFDEASQLRGYGKVVRDMTDQRAAETASLARGAQLRAIMDNMPIAMVVSDEDGTILAINRAAEQLFGHTETALRGANVRTLMPSDGTSTEGQAAAWITSNRRQAAGLSPLAIGLRRDGTTFPHSLIVGEIGDNGRRLFTAFMSDMTEQVAAEQRLADMQSELIHVARFSAMGTMASTLAHELNQPITAVVTYLGTVRAMLDEAKTGDLPMIVEAMAAAEADAMRAGSIVSNLRDFVARGDVEKSVNSLNELISAAATLASIDARERGISLEVLPMPSDAHVLVDKIQIQQVLVNLIRNACEAMEQSAERRLTISCTMQNADSVRITVADTGPGINGNLASDLFGAFVTSKSTGMGLGLSICRTIIEANGGRIWHEPRQGGGAQFQFTLSRIRLEVADAG